MQSIFNIKKDYSYLAFLFILLLTIITRFYNIGTDSLWLDEGASLRFASLPLKQILIEHFQNGEPNPPLFYFILHFWIKIFGTQEAALRSLSAIFSVLSVFAVFSIGKSLFSRKIALYAALIFALSAFHVFYGQELRSYSFFNFLILISVYSFLQLFSRKEIRYKLIYIVSAVLLILTHPYAWFVLVFENIWALYFIGNKKTDSISLKGWLLLQLFVFILLTPYIYYFVQVVLNVEQSFWVKRPGLKHLAGAFFMFSASFYLSVIFGLVLMNLSWSQMKSRFSALNKSWPLQFTFLWLLTPVLLPFIISQFSTPVYLVRYAIISSVPFYLIIAFDIEYLPGKKYKIFIIGLIILFSGFELNSDYRAVTREPWREVAEYLKEHSAGDDVFLVGAEFCLYETFDYYGKQLPNKRVGISKEKMQLQNWKADLIKQLENPRADIWFVSSHFWNHEDSVLALLSNRYEAGPQKEYRIKDLYNRNVSAITLYKYFVLERENK